MRQGDKDILDGLRSVMTGYLSSASVDSTLEISLRELGFEGSRLDSEQLPRLVERAMLGLRLFCEAERLPDLMLDLAEYCDEADS